MCGFLLLRNFMHERFNFESYIKNFRVVWRQSFDHKPWHSEGKSSLSEFAKENSARIVFAGSYAKNGIVFGCVGACIVMLLISRPGLVAAAALVYERLVWSAEPIKYLARFSVAPAARQLALIVLWFVDERFDTKFCSVCSSDQRKLSHVCLLVFIIDQ